MNWTEFCQKYGIKLNKQQQEAVRTIDGPVLLLAVPGSGKTTVLVTRLAYMKECCGIDPRKVLTLTYTVAATRDMSKRYTKLYGDSSAEIPFEFRTINGVCAKIIRYYEQAEGRKAFTLLTDEKILTGYISQIYRDVLQNYPTESDIKDIKTKITFTKNMMLSNDEILEMDEQSLPFSKIYQTYQEKLQSSMQMDFDDQMVYANIILKKYPKILQYFQNQYHYICVDEAQDTSKIQHAIIDLLSQKSKNLFMVGDEDQSIYTFRAAYPEALLHFERLHQNAKVLLMESNYRSDSNIVTAADRFIQNNKSRHEKHMSAIREAKNKIEVVNLKKRDDQYNIILHMARDTSRETAVLYRENESVLPIIDMLERQNIPYRMRSHDSVFFTNRVVVDIVSVLQYALNPKNTDLFLQIYYKISTFLKKEDALKACRISEEMEIGVLEAVIDYMNPSPYTIRNCKSMMTHLEHLLEESPQRAILRILRFMGYKEYLQKMKLKENKVDILLTLAERESTIEGFLKRLEDLAYIVGNQIKNAESSLILSTIHSSKGLEYDHVFMLDVIDGIFPEKAVWDTDNADDEDLREFEEERRLFYVGITRAKNRLTLLRTEAESIFYTELLQLNRKSNNKKLVDKKINIQTNTAELREKALLYKKGRRIIHNTFGEGTILNSTAMTIEVRFDKGITEKLNLIFVLEHGMITLK